MLFTPSAACPTPRAFRFKKIRLRCTAVEVRHHTHRPYCRRVPASVGHDPMLRSPLARQHICRHDVLDDEPRSKDSSNQDLGSKPWKLRSVTAISTMVLLPMISGMTCGWPQHLKSWFCKPSMNWRMSANTGILLWSLQVRNVAR